MKVRKTVSIILCVIFLLVSSLYFVTTEYLDNNYYPGLNTASFAPAKVIKANNEKDITVKVYPTGGISSHEPDSKKAHEISLNRINKGWIVAQYHGNCRLLFEINDADMEDFATFSENIDHYYYAETIPVERLIITDLTARHNEDASDPFNGDTKPFYFHLSINIEISKYYSARFGWLPFTGINAAFILIVIGVNLIISKIAKQKK